MGRRFSAGTDAAVAGVLAAVGVAVVFLRGDYAWPTMAIALAPACVAGVVLIVLASTVPSLTAHGNPGAPDRWALAVSHAALTHLAARALLTGPNPTVAVHELLTPATLWLSPASLLGLLLLSILLQSITHRRRARPVS